MTVQGAADNRSLVATLVQATFAAVGFAEEARRVVATQVTAGEGIDAALLNREQRAVHGLAWIATVATALGQTAEWAQRLDARNALGPGEAALLHIGFGE